jgi:SagB-type dehydrogenase family enzyme
MIFQHDSRKEDFMERLNLSVGVKLIITGAVLAGLFCLMIVTDRPIQAEQGGPGTIISLPQPVLDGSVSIEKALSERRTLRTYRDQPLTMAEISQVLWAAQGITEPKKGLRTAPSARAMYLLQLYLIADHVTNLPAGMYKYQPQGHQLIKVADGEAKSILFGAAPQNPIKNAPAVILVSGFPAKATNPTWMCLEAGHVAQNVALQAVSLKLGIVTIGGFKPEEVKKALKLPENEQPIYILPVGKK